MTATRRRRVYDDDLPKTHDVRYGLLFIFGLAGVLVLLYAVGFFVAGDKLPSGTAIGGVDVGGMTSDQARTAVQEELAPRVEKPLSLMAAGKTYRINPQRAGMAFDIDASVDTALGGASWDPRHMVRVLLGGGDFQPELVVDRGELHATLAKVAAQVASGASDATVSFAGRKPQVQFGRSGQALDVDESMRRLTAAVRAGDDRVRLPVSGVDPAVTSTEANTFAGTVATRAVSEPVTLRVAHAKLVLKPKVFAPALRTEVVDSDLRLTVDAERLYGRSRAAIASLRRAPVNAKIGFGRFHPVVTPGRTGVSVSPDDWAGAVLKAVSRQGAERTARVETSPQEPAFTTKDARALGVSKQVASAATRYPSLPATELAPAARQLDGVLLRPGETLSILDRVDARRYPQAATLLAATAFDAAFRAGLTVVERSPVVFYTDQYPLGRDARVSPAGRDLQLRNDSPYGVYVRATVERLRGGGASLHVDLWSTPYWQIKVHTSPRHHVVKPKTERVKSRRCQPQRGITGFDVDVTRVFLRHGKRVDSDVTHTAYHSQGRVVCR